MLIQRKIFFYNVGAFAAVHIINYKLNKNERLSRIQELNYECQVIGNIYENPQLLQQ